jgi:hypothetical protein
MKAVLTVFWNKHGIQFELLDEGETMTQQATAKHRRN